MVGEVLSAEILSPHLVLVKPERGRLSACRSEQLRGLQRDIERLRPSRTPRYRESARRHV